MSKLIINIKSLTINLGAGQSAAGLPLILGTLIHRAMAEAQDDQVTGAQTGAGQDTGGDKTDDTDVQATADTAADATETKVVPILTEDHVLVFLSSDPRYTKRTFKSISAYFEDATADEIETLLDQLIDEGKVKRTTRRGDHAALFESLVPTEAAPLAEAPAAEASTTEAVSTPPAMTETNVRSFLGSDPRYSKRTFDALAKHFGLKEEDTDDALAELLRNMADAGDIAVKHRRADGVELYQLA